MKEHNTWFSKIFHLEDITQGKLDQWLNALEEDPRWDMTFAEKVVPIGEKVLVVICVTPVQQA